MRAGTKVMDGAVATFEARLAPVNESTELVEDLRRGNVGALASAYDAHHEAVRSFARRLVGDDAAAEDLVQEAFLALPRTIHRFRGDATLRSFILGVTANHARHHVRAAARRRAAYRRSGDDDAPPPSTPEDRARKRQLAEALTFALDELPFDQRLAIVLCEVEERTSGEAARITNVPEATIRTRLFHAKRKLREILSARGVR